jgi:hypothetical protein
MTIDIIDKISVAVVNMHVLDKWFSTSYGLINGKFIDWIQRDKVALLSVFQEVFIKKAESLSQHLIDECVRYLYSSLDNDETDDETNE